MWAVFKIDTATAKETPVIEAIATADKADAIAVRMAYCDDDKAVRYEARQTSK